MTSDPTDLVPVLDAETAEPTTPDAPPDAAPFAGDGLPAEPAPPPDPALVAATMTLLADVELDVTVELGRCRLPLGEVARLGVGSVVELDTLAGEPLVVYANGRRIASGEAVVVDGQFGIRIGRLFRAGDRAD